VGTGGSDDGRAAWKPRTVIARFVSEYSIDDGVPAVDTVPGIVEHWFYHGSAPPPALANRPVFSKEAIADMKHTAFSLYT
jgi:hypothetical protein